MTRVHQQTITRDGTSLQNEIQLNECAFEIEATVIVLLHQNVFQRQPSLSDNTHEIEKLESN